MNMLATPRQRLVIVGNGMAGIRALGEILRRAPLAFDITVFGQEPHGGYDRILLSPVLAGEKTFAEIVTHDRDWYAEKGIELIAGEAVAEIDRCSRVVRGEHGTCRPYDILLLATGAEPVVLPVPGARLPGVMTFRDIADVEAMRAAGRGGGQKAIVIGGGLLGLEAAHGLSRRGLNVTVLQLPRTLMERQLDPVSAGMLRADLEARGLTIITAANTTAILGEDHVTGVRLADGHELQADLVVMAVGIRPLATLARAAGISVGRGVRVDDGMRTSDPAIFAVGECVEHRGAVYELVAPLWEMAKTCAVSMTGGDGIFVPPASGTRLKVTGIDMFSAGDFLGGEGCEEIAFRDAARGIHKRLVLRGPTLVGVVLYGDARDAAWYFDFLRTGTDISAIRDRVIFGPVVAGVAPAGVGVLAETAEICGCNGVSKGQILAAIDAHGLTTVDAVRARTKASSSCGSCASQVEALLRHALGDRFGAAPTIKPICKCTALGHDEVRAKIRAKTWKTIPEVMRALGWSSPDGCATCRPALNFYLLCEFPAEYVDDAQSRFTNERMHANIQKDGTFSVVPRLWGGVTSARELRAIADVVDKHAIPTVKVTGGQRLDLLGVRREQLPDVWRDLNRAGLVSGHAYGKALRTVKTCVGSEWCRFGVQDSTAMGIALEKMCWGSWTPHKVKLAVSGCPRNCAEATIKDFGVVAVDSGWEIHVAGNGGIKVRVTDLIAKVATADEVLEYCGAFLQLYREGARYLERTAHWVERVGISLVRERIVDDAESRAALHARFLTAQRYVQDDPWAREAGRAERFVDLATMG